MIDTTANRSDDPTSEVFDDIGAYTIPPKNGDPVYDIRGIVAYCEKKGIEPFDMSDEERNKFVVYYWSDQS